MKFRFNVRMLAGGMTCAIALCAIPAWAASTVHLNVKPGLWQTTTKAKLSGSMIPESVLQQMPPEQRQKMQAAMAEAQKPHTQQTCVSRDDLMKDFANSNSKDCKWSTTSNTSTTLEYHGSCNDGTESSTVTVHLEAISSELLKGTMQFDVSREGKHVAGGDGTFSSKWLNSSCGNVK